MGWAFSTLRALGSVTALVALSSCRPPGSAPPRAVAPFATAWPALDESFLAASAATMNFRLGRPKALAITADGAVLFRRTPPRERTASLYELDPRTGTERVLVDAAALLAGNGEGLSEQEKARRERTRTATNGVVDIDVSEDGQTVLVPLGKRVFVVDRKEGRARELEVAAGFPYDPRLSPDGAWAAYVVDGNLWLSDARGQKKPRRLTEHPAGDIEYGVAEFVAQEELDRRRGYWWAPDGKSLLFQRTDSARVQTLFVSDPRHPERPAVPFKYPRAGTENAAVDLGVVSVEGGPPRWLAWDRERYPYLAKVGWKQHALPWCVVMNREQTESALITLDPGTGGVRTLLTEKDPAWLELVPGSPTWLDDGSGFLWISGTGVRTLEHRRPDGSLVRALTPEAFGVREIAGVEPDGRAGIIQAETDPRRENVFRVPLDGSATTALTTGPGVNSALADHGLTVVASALHEGGATYAVHAAGAVQPLVSVAERASLKPTTVLESVQSGGRNFYTAITRPTAFRPGKRYPVILRVYGGPGAKNVQDFGDAYLLDQWYADAGFVVVRAEGRGTPDRGHDWERAISKDMLTLPLTDQVDALRAMGAAHPEMDLERVGVFGWSFGGYLSTMAVLLRPDVVHAAVAGAPPTDWALYDTAYTERYMGTPASNPAGYQATSALTHASKLTRPLLLIHGITDDNVHFAHTLAFIEALFVAGKRAEVIALSSTHMVPDSKLLFAREKVQVDFFREHLGPPK